MAFLLFWCVFAVGVGWVMATIESKVNNAPKRTRSAILWSVFAGPIGWIVVVMRSNLKFASDFGASQRLQGELARQQLDAARAAQSQPKPD